MSVLQGGFTTSVVRILCDSTDTSSVRGKIKQGASDFAIHHMITKPPTLS